MIKAQRLTRTRLDFNRSHHRQSDLPNLKVSAEFSGTPAIRMPSWGGGFSLARSGRRHIYEFSRNAKLNVPLEQFAVNSLHNETAHGVITAGCWITRRTHRFSRDAVWPRILRHRSPGMMPVVTRTRVTLRLRRSLCRSSPCCVTHVKMMPRASKDAVQQHRQEHETSNQSGHYATPNRFSYYRYNITLQTAIREDEPEFFGLRNAATLNVFSIWRHP